MKTLEVINACLGTMGETPLSSLADPHSYKAAAQACLDRVDKRIQAKGWWFNKERITIPPSAIDSKYYLPGDVIELQADDVQWAQRGRLVYDKERGTYTGTTPIKVGIVRRLDFDIIPEVVAQYIGMSAVLEFQKSYDGDSTKTGQLMNDLAVYRVDANAADIRNAGANMIYNNPRIMRIKRKLARYTRY